MRWVAGKTFYLREGVWTDAAWPDGEEGSERVLRLRPFGEGYFKLLDAWPAAAGAMALGERVRVMAGDVAVEIAADGAGDLSGREWSRIQSALPKPRQR